MSVKREASAPLKSKVTVPAFSGSVAVKVAHVARRRSRHTLHVFGVYMSGVSFTPVTVMVTVMASVTPAGSVAVTVTV